MGNAKQLIEAAGGQSEVARRFKTTPQAIYKWGKLNRIPPERVLDLIEMAGGGFEAADFCPQVFRRPGLQQKAA